MRTPDLPLFAACAALVALLTLGCGEDAASGGRQRADLGLDAAVADARPPDRGPDDTGVIDRGPLDAQADAQRDLGADVATDGSGGDAFDGRCGPVDTDGDGVFDGCDVCPEVADPEQADRDGDRLGDACDARPDQRDLVLGAGRVVRFGRGAATVDGRFEPGPGPGLELRGGRYVMRLQGGWR